MYLLHRSGQEKTEEMDIRFKGDKLRKICSDQRLAEKAYGKAGGKMLRKRLDALRFAPNLELMRKLPGGCHELKGDRAGQFAVDLDGPNRLIFEPAQDPVPVKQDGGIDWSEVTCITILGREDYHD